MSRTFRFFIPAMGLLSALSAQAQTIVQGGFEAWPANCPVNGPPNGWANFSTSLGPDQAGSCAGTVVSFEGSSHMNLVWYSGTGLLEGAAQAVTGLVVGNTYEVSFHAIHDQGLYAANDPTRLEASINGNVMLTTPDLISGDPWAQYSFQFTATSSTHVLGFRVAAGSFGTTGCVGVDAVSISSATGIAPPDAAQPHALNAWYDGAQAALWVNDPQFTNAPYDLLDGSGGLVRSGVLSTQRIDVEALPQGLYVLRFTALQAVHRFVKF